MKPIVDLIKALHGFLFVAEGFNHLDLAQGFIYHGSLLTSGRGLSLEHGIRSRSNEFGHQQGQGSDKNHHQRNAPMNPQHNDQCPQNGHHAGEQLSKPQEQSIRKSIHIRDQSAHGISLGMAVQIAQRQHLNVSKCFVANIPCHPEGNTIMDLTHDPLGSRCRQRAYCHRNQVRFHSLKVYLPLLDNTVDGFAYQNRDHQQHHDRKHSQQQRNHQTQPIAADIPKYFFKHRGLELSHGCPPPSGTENNKSPDIPGRKSSVRHGSPSPPDIHRPKPGSDPQIAEEQLSGIQ